MAETPLRPNLQHTNLPSNTLLGLFVLVVVIAGGWRMYTRNTLESAQTELGRIVVTMQGKDRLDALTVFADNSPSSLKNAVRLEEAATAMELGDYQRAAAAYAALSGDDGGAGVVAGIGDLFTLGTIGVVMLFIDWQLALAAFVVIPLVLLVSRVFQNKVRSSYRVIRTRVAQLNAYLGERLSGIRIVQLFGREAGEIARFETLNQGHLDAQLKSITYYALYFPAIEFLTTLALASLLVTSGVLVEREALTVGTVAAFLQLVRRFFQPLQDLSEKYNILQAAMAASERIFGLLDTPPAPGLTPTPDLAQRVARVRAEGITITFENVWFAYESGGGISEDRVQQPTDLPSDTEVRWVLKDVSFTVAPGHSLALVGHTGAGKTTIVNLLLRFHDPQRGRILMNGEDIRDIPVDVLRSVMGYVQQDIFLFAGDIAANLRLGSPIDDGGRRPGD